ncbi:bifunctional 4-hydroxy-3-methylbut-2-enyl diphosphate reductase/30S ribosomal protein S1 [Clostridium botulinum]|uniref:bifunctional 4-hydroxy-3-methylbut-2-enyl diphosphate reductase/30S ribosomal protein S1 n=1 Tax=unclassified Clostridium TaxID=2614128 RepID=UPI0005033632|nr:MULTISPECIES: bifunctional 4-hydroxy-3-methylbut-2-enyl diphosphate reductase/30S ribosomal protein S1 [unclassified Clostridium]AIY80645.1 4-hydroxy-3-methylbut-2-enyl diphosphate reductase [Clostridium botulinum 202F]KAI3345856.1 bifunctional 4-hydroxy-3-methylbut-2-enyl diphosphate reductase/30S ribosomal protein S1 [Clostridium botulinum]KFX54123.1 4-hydroxy-3-methylbut-2-enyl diphosphate reductase [Clostridium botulinum]KON12119.1 4-hydroxy-3-methylbut-2-enyl diphosphate reductase [Clos
MKEVILAQNAGFCFGVKRAVDEAIKIQKQAEKKIYTLGPLIHNNDVVKFLEKNNIYSIELENITTLNKDDVIVIRSHGVSEEILNILQKNELKVKDATCPFVTNIQKKVNKYYKLGYNIVILGDANHPEVIGINGWCNNEAIISKNGEVDDDVPAKVCVVSQTTEKVANWETLIKNVSSKAKEVLAFNTICAATDVRQRSTSKLSKEVETMVVIGGKNSSNTTKLYQIAKQNCDNTIHIENVNELPKDFINNNINKVGITAGASTPDWIIREVIGIMSNTENIKNDDQLSLMNQLDRRFVIGDEVEGEILSKTRDTIIVSLVGYKMDGVIPFNELTSNEDIESMVESLNIGDSIKSKVIKLQNSDGYVVLSRLEYEKEEAYKELDTLFNEGKTFEVKIKEASENGLVAYYKGIRIFIPASQIDVKFTKDKSRYINQVLEVKLIDYSAEEHKKVIASRRVLLEVLKETEEEKIWESLNVGDVIKAEVKRFTNFGAFLDVNGIDGLLHLSQISWNHVKNIEDILKKGEMIEVKIIALDKENKKLSLSRKELLPKPWENVKEKYPEGSIVLGKVVRINDFGAFIELEPGVDGLVHISKISFNRISHPSEVLSVGEEVKAKILEVDEENKRVSLSIKDI